MFVPPPPGDRPFPLWPPLLATEGAGERSAPHAHHAMHFILGLEGPLRVRRAGRWTEAPGLLSAPDQAHELDARGTRVRLVFLDPESTGGQTLQQRIADGLRLLSEDECAKLLLPATSPLQLMQREGAAWLERAAVALGSSEAPPRRLHPGVRRALKHLQGADVVDHSLPALAGIAGLSEGRFMHAFTESIGIPIRPYLAWLKLQRAAAAIATGSPLTDAAFGAGFSDAAHMTRSFKRMLGLKPTELQARVSKL
jgi:AraC-like DNA-binding protein